MVKEIFYYSNNLKLYGILDKVNENKTLAIICHPRTSNKNSRAVTSLSNALSQNNINNFRFDFLSCGDSQGNIKDYCVTNMLNNLNDTLKEMQNTYGFENFILIGLSMGARIVALANHKDFHIIKLVLWYGAFNYPKKLFNRPSKKEKIAKKQGYYEIENNVKLSYNYFVDERKYNAYKSLINWDVPKLFIHGTADKYVSFKSSVKISRKAPHSKLILMGGANHGFHNGNDLNFAISKTINYIKETS